MKLTLRTTPTLPVLITGSINPVSSLTFLMKKITDKSELLRGGTQVAGVRLPGIAGPVGRAVDAAIAIEHGTRSCLISHPATYSLSPPQLLAADYQFRGIQAT